MKISITFDDGKIVELPSKNEIVHTINAKYPEMGMMVAMEELNELAIALSKGVRNGNKDKLDNIAEEIMDSCAVIQWAIDRFNITPDMLQKWVDYKIDRNDDRMVDDSLIFRTTEAKDAYHHAHIDPKNQLLITRMEDGKYSLDGNTEDMAEYFHVLETGLFDNNPASIEKPAKKKKEETPKMKKKASKELDKVLDKATKKAKDVDKKKDSKKKDDKKKKDEKKKDDKKGKKDKK